ncbi:hypothetical protein DUNSADRAFT_5735, partial [Dunaliella salina]
MPTPTPEPRSSLEGRDADEAAAALRELSELSGPSSGSKMAEEYWFGSGQQDQKAGGPEQVRQEDEKEAGLG